MHYYPKENSNTPIMPRPIPQPSLMSFKEDIKTCPERLPYDDPDVPTALIFDVVRRNLDCGFVSLAIYQLKTFRGSPFIKPASQCV